MSAVLKSREREAILQSLRAGVVPRIGLEHIQVGRKEEVAAILKDLENISQGSSSIRFIIGRFGTGKSFFLNLARIVALEKKFVVAQADITPDRRLHATGGQGRSLYAELMHNLAVRAKPEGGALPSVIEKWVSDLDYELRAKGASDQEVLKTIPEKLKPLQEMVSGYDFALVIRKYFEGYLSHNDAWMTSAVRWLRGEYTTKTEARTDLAVRSIIDDLTVYEYLKLMAAFIRMAGYSGLLVNLDEMGVLSHRLNNTQARNANFEMILRIVNDCLQGNVSGIGFIFAGTDAFLDDKRRGLASYEALATRLASNSFAASGLKDLSNPVIRLANLAPEDLFVLFHNIRNVFAMNDQAKYLVPDEALKEFLNYCSKTLGADFYRTPRDSVKGFVGFLSVLEQNPGTNWKAVLGQTKIEQSKDPESEPAVNEQAAGAAISQATDQPSANDELATFKL
ncbi:MAG: ATP-binding protein [Kiritimatiellae bacterium]|nr:ATP-binding protein [Kiritimatiellia bacterium]MDD5520985.1 ATP-binding protein [Kiritimatiellia bacterium]